MGDEMTAEELFNKHKADIMDCGYDAMDIEEFTAALSEHDKEIRDKIESMIENEKKSFFGDYPDEGYIQALTELLIFVKEK